jgi:hypothetical protein
MNRIPKTQVPMLELLAYLRANGFKTYIVSGGHRVMRPWTERDCCWPAPGERSVVLRRPLMA